MAEQIIIGKKASSNLFIKTGTLINLEKLLYKAYERVFGIDVNS